MPVVMKLSSRNGLDGCRPKVIVVVNRFWRFKNTCRTDRLSSFIAETSGDAAFSKFVGMKIINGRLHAWVAAGLGARLNNPPVLSGSFDDPSALSSFDTNEKPSLDHQDLQEAILFDTGVVY